jgi:hypothetical protein
MKLDPILSNPYLGYRLDPYEPGLIHAAKASESTLQVTAQEQRNLNRLVGQAAQEGRAVVWERITYQPTVAGSYMGTAAGQTTVISVEKPQKETALALDNPAEKGTQNSPAPGAAEDQNQAGQNSDALAALSMSADPELAQESLDELTEQEMALQAKIATLESQLQEADHSPPKEGDDLAAGQATREERYLSREVREKQAELNKIAMARLMKMQADLMATTNQGFIENSLAPLAMVKLAYGAGSQSAAQGTLDKII